MHDSFRNIKAMHDLCGVFTISSRCNRFWLTKNPWFEVEMLLELRRQVDALIL
ncbi:hypothetical protein J1D01_00925 [Seonamhaeicola sp. NFXS20]|uniref:hypothetical protein n=1 Tax=unclassified Seonamhaeicola TaxID=2622645 RepID=UPI003564B0E7